MILYPKIYMILIFISALVLRVNRIDVIKFYCYTVCSSISMHTHMYTHTGISENHYIMQNCVVKQHKILGKVSLELQDSKITNKAS